MTVDRLHVRVSACNRHCTEQYKQGQDSRTVQSNNDCRAQVYWDVVVQMELHLGRVSAFAIFLWFAHLIFVARHEFEWKREECYMLRKPDPPVLVAITKDTPGRLKTTNVQILDYNLNRYVPHATRQHD